MPLAGCGGPISPRTEAAGRKAQRTIRKSTRAGREGAAGSGGPQGAGSGRPPGRGARGAPASAELGPARPPPAGPPARAARRRPGGAPRPRPHRPPRPPPADLTIDRQRDAGGLAQPVTQHGTRAHAPGRLRLSELCA